MWPTGCQLDRLGLEQLSSPKSTFTHNQFCYSEELGKECSNNAMYGDYPPCQKTFLTGELSIAYCYSLEEPSAESREGHKLQHWTGCGVTEQEALSGTTR